MINFKLKPYEWQNSMNMLMQNVDLSKIDFLVDRSMLFTFHNTYDGGFYKKIRCHNVWKFTKDINMEKGEGFAYFICDIRAAKLEGSEIEGAFDYFQYILSVPHSNEYTLLCMDSGDISISVICETVEIV